MRKLIMISALAAAAVAEEGFVPAQPIHIEPLAGIDVAPGAVFADTVILKLTVDEEGRVEDAEVWSSSGDEAIDAAGLASARKCLFKPATQDGEPVVSYYQIYYRLSAYRTREYAGAEEKAGTAEKAPTPEEDDGGRD
ncbi:MAG: TonB family protein [candidate division Zixibacteria bacterium]|nr:TonB family protein [candidate division Zixibacteria bacterium]